MSAPHRCDLCGQAIAPHEHYLVRIDVLADPSTPPLSTAGMKSLSEGGSDELAALMQQLKEFSAEQLQDQVHRRMEFVLCASCQRKFLDNPLGLPRRQVVSQN